MWNLSPNGKPIDFMSKLSPNITGSFHVDISKYPKLSTSQIAQALASFVKAQHPSWTGRTGNTVKFSNRLFRAKVSRAHNFTRAFNKGTIEVEKEGDHVNINYSGSLYRGISIAAIQTLIFSFGVSFIAPSALYIAPAFFLLGYFFQVYMTHVVFPMSITKEVHLLITKDEEEE